VILINRTVILKLEVANSVNLIFIPKIALNVKILANGNAMNNKVVLNAKMRTNGTSGVIAIAQLIAK
jgi:hypothetical protein